MFLIKFVEEIKKHFVFSSIFKKNRAVCKIMLKILKSRQDIDSNKAMSRCMLDN